jgi:hypothetical protein
MVVLRCCAAAGIGVLRFDGDGETLRFFFF